MAKGSGAAIIVSAFTTHKMLSPPVVAVGSRCVWVYEFEVNLLINTRDMCTMKCAQAG